MKPSSTKPSQKSAETIYAELKSDIRSGLSLIDATVNSLAKAKFILQNCLEQSQQLFKATNSSTLSKNSASKNNGKQHRRLSSSSNEILLKKRSSSSSSSSSSTSSCSTCSGGGKKKKQKPLLLLPSPRGGSLQCIAKYKPQQSSLPPQKKKPPPPPIKKAWSFYTGKAPSNYLSLLSPKLLKLLDTDRVCKVGLLDCKRRRKRLNSTEVTERSSTMSSKETKKDLSRDSTVIATPTDLTSLEKPSLSMFEDLLEKTKPQENRVKIGSCTLETVEVTPKKTSSETIVIKPDVKPYKPGPKSKQKVTNDDDPPLQPVPTRLDSTFEDSPKSSEEPAPPPIKKPRIGPKSKTRPPSPPLPLLPNSEDIKQKLLDSFREFQQKQRSQQLPPTEVKTEDVLSALSRDATTENSSDSDSDESEIYSLHEQNRGHFFLSPNDNNPFRLLRFEGPSSSPKFKHLPLSKLSKDELEQFKRDFIT